MPRENNKGRGFLSLFQSTRKDMLLALRFVYFLLNFYNVFFYLGIEISGIEKIDENTVRQLLYENGLKIGMLKNMVDVDAVNKMMTNMPEIAWIGINIIALKQRWK